MRIVPFVSALLLAAAASAQTPPLIHDTTVRKDDSPLVAAAKRAVAARRGAVTAQNGWAIDDAMVGHSLLAPAAIPPQLAGSASPQSEVSATFSSYDAKGARAAAGKQRAALEQEQRRMAEEHDQPYAGDVSEDRVEQRLTQIPTEIEATKPPR